MQNRWIRWLLIGIVVMGLSACGSSTATPTAEPTLAPSKDSVDSINPAYPAQPGIVEDQPTPEVAYPSAENEAAQPEAAYPADGETAVEAGPEILVYTTDGNSTSVSRDFLTSMPQTTVEVNGVTLQGPKLSDVLVAANLNDFASLVFENASQESLTLEKGQVDDQVILDLISDPTQVTLVVGSLPAEQWLEGITTIRAQ